VRRSPRERRIQNIPYTRQQFKSSQVAFFGADDKSAKARREQGLFAV
jgi:hypothetical protein